MVGAEVIVVGAGAAGCVVARRLADAGRPVLVLEAGPAGPGPSALRSIDGTEALAVAERFSRRVSAIAGQRMVPYQVGQGVGGSSAVNAMVLTAGDRADYDHWAAERGCPGWDSSGLEPWLARAAGTLGRTEAEAGPLARAWAAAATAAGHPSGGPSVDLDARGVLTASLAAAGGRRRSAADAYLLDSPGPGYRPGLEVRPWAAVGRLTTTGHRVRGVELEDGTRLEADDVVLCAGAVTSPLLLRASGLLAPGSTAAPVADHPSFVFTVALRAGARQDPARPVPAISGLLRWSSAGDGGPVDLMALAMDHVGQGPDGRRYGALIVVLTDVVSAGIVTGDPAGPVTIHPGWLHHEHDRQRFRAGVRHVAALVMSGGLDEVAEAVYLDDRGTPVADLASFGDAELDTWLISHPGPVRHGAATAPMGQPGWPGATVDLRGAVPGWTGLHVADASVLPHVPNANPMLAVLAVAERLAAALAGADVGLGAATLR